MAPNRNPANLAEDHRGGLAEKLMEASEGLYPSRSLGGFACVVVCYLEHALGLDK